MAGLRLHSLAGAVCADQLELDEGIAGFFDAKGGDAGLNSRESTAVGATLPPLLLVVEPGVVC